MIMAGTRNVPLVTFVATKPMIWAMPLPDDFSPPIASTGIVSLPPLASRSLLSIAS